MYFVSLISPFPLQLQPFRREKATLSSLLGRAGKVRVVTALLSLLLLVQSCDDDDSGQTEAGLLPSENSEPDLGSTAAYEASAASALVPGKSNPSPQTSGLNTLGGEATQNQQAFRQRFGLSDPDQEQLSNWQPYEARLTAYSNKDPDWPFPTAASGNWLGSTWNGDPLAIEGTTVAVDFSRIPRGSLLYIPSLDMYAEANDTGATARWAQSDARFSDYGSQGVGRIDVYSVAAGRSSAQVERNFQNRVGNHEFGAIYIVSRGTAWRQGRR